MFGSLSELRAAMASFVASFDATSVCAAEAARALDDAAAVEKMASSIKASVASRISDADAARNGERSAAHAVARACGTTVAHARDHLETARKLESLSATARATRDGSLSMQQAAVIADAAGIVPDEEQRLLRTARRASLGELRDECARVKAAALGADEQHRQIHTRRMARRRTCADGSGEILYRSTKDEVAEIWAVVQPYVDRAFHAARKRGDHESSEAYAADGLLAMARAAASGAPTIDRPVPAKVIVRIDWDALVRGWPIDDEVCEIAGVGPVPVSVVEGMIDSGDALLAAVVTRGVDVYNVAHLGRRPTAAQQTALEWLHPTCTALGCNQTVGRERDHRVDWAATRFTLLRFLDYPCPYHHDLKTRHGWKFVDGTGKREMVPPDDPRHPDNHDPP